MGQSQVKPYFSSHFHDFHFSISYVFCDYMITMSLIINHLSLTINQIIFCGFNNAGYQFYDFRSIFIDTFEFDI